jgi:predicted amidohydrolase YtcJ
VVEDRADVIFHNGVILTIDAEFNIAEAIAIQGDKILAVGYSDEILRMADSETELINLDGQTVLPGFVDGHTHILAFPFRMDKTLAEAQELALSQGFTSVTEMWADDGFIQQLLEAEESGQLNLRVNLFPIFNRAIHDDDGNRVIVETWYPGNTPILDHERMLRIPGIKVYVDGAGVPGRGCPAMSVLYGEEAQAADWFKESCLSEYGDLYWEQEELNQVVAEAQAAGYRVAFHVMGDRGIEATLDAIAFALGDHTNDLRRHQIQHSSLIRPELLERYVSMDVLSSVRGYFNTCDQDAYERDWAANRYALPGLGVHAYLETDFGWTVDPDEIYSLRSGNSMIHLYGLVTHEQVNSDGSICTPAPWLARHVISVEQALRMMTYEPAYAVSQEDVLGTLEPGKFADLIILSDNPVTINPSDLKDLEVWLTMVGGKVEYCAPGHEEFCPKFQPGTTTPAEPATITVTETSDPYIESVVVRLALGETRVSVDTPVLLTFSWACDSPEQVEEFLSAITFDIILDGQPLPDATDYWGEVEEAGDLDEDGDMDYKSVWLYPLGVLNPGSHIVDTHAFLQKNITDGFDVDGDDLPDDYSGIIHQVSQQIVVEE